MLRLLTPIWAHLSNLTVDSCEQGAAMRLFHLTPALSSLKITSLFTYEYPALSSLKRISPFTYEFHLEPLTHTSIQSLSVLGRRPPTYSGWRLRNPAVTFLNALTLPNLRVLNVGARSWTGEELKGVVLGVIPSEWLLTLELRLNLRIAMSGTSEQGFEQPILATYGVFHQGILSVIPDRSVLNNGRPPYADHAMQSTCSAYSSQRSRSLHHQQ